jgi:hypothetical protein
MPDEPSYRVFWSRKAMDTLKDLGRRASTSDLRKELARSVKTLDERLRREAPVVGEIYRSRGVVEEHLAVQGFVAIDFAIDKERQFVLVRDCRALSGHGL